MAAFSATSLKEAIVPTSDCNEQELQWNPGGLEYFDPVGLSVSRQIPKVDPLEAGACERLHQSILNSPVYHNLINDNHSTNLESCESSRFLANCIEPKYIIKNFDNLSEDNFCTILNAMRFWEITLLPYEVLLFVVENWYDIEDIYIENFQKDIFNEKVVIYFQEIDIIFNYYSVFEDDNESNDDQSNNSSKYDYDYEKEELITEFYLEIAKIGSINLLKISKCYGIFAYLSTTYQAKKNGEIIQNESQVKLIIEKLNRLGPIYHSFSGLHSLNIEDSQIEVEYNIVKIMFQGESRDYWYRMPYEDWYNIKKYNRGGLPTLDTRPYIDVIDRYMKVHVSKEKKGSPITLNDILFASRALCADGTRVIDRYKILSDNNSTLILVPTIDNFST